MKVLSFEQLPQDGFAGLKERRFIINQSFFGRSKTIAHSGIGNCVYLADANFVGLGETGMHSHKNIDVVSVMVSGRIQHQGSLANGELLTAGMAQVQRSGDIGFSHNEINPDVSDNQMIQIWLVPETRSEAEADYQSYPACASELQHIYGKGTRFNSSTEVQLANFTAGQQIKMNKPSLVFVSSGQASINGQIITARTLVAADSIELNAESSGQAIFISHNPA